MAAAITLLAALTVWIAPSVKWDQAMDQCMSSDPGATSFEIRWSYLPPGYVCTTSDREPRSESLIPYGAP